MKVHILVQKNKLNTSAENLDVCSRDEQSSSSNKQSNTCTENKENKNCQVDKCDMQPKKLKKDMQSNETAMLIQHKKLREQIVPQEDDKNVNLSEFITSPSVLIRTVKEVKISIYSQWPIQKYWMCSYPNQQYQISTEDCVVTKVVNLQDATRKEIMTKNCQSDNIMCYKKWNLNLKELITSVICAQQWKQLICGEYQNCSIPKSDCKWIVLSLK